MAEPDKTSVPESVEDRETPETLAAIRRGIADADAGRVTPLEEVREMLHGWSQNQALGGE